MIRKLLIGEKPCCMPKLDAKTLTTIDRGAIQQRLWQTSSPILHGSDNNIISLQDVRDSYKTLGLAIDRPATEDAIKKATRTLQKSNHPDRDPERIRTLKEVERLKAALSAADDDAKPALSISLDSAEKAYKSADDAATAKIIKINGAQDLLLNDYRNQPRSTVKLPSINDRAAHAVKRLETDLHRHFSRNDPTRGWTLIGEMRNPLGRAFPVSHLPESVKNDLLANARQTFQGHSGIRITFETFPNFDQCLAIRGTGVGYIKGAELMEHVLTGRSITQTLEAASRAAATRRIPASPRPMGSDPQPTPPPPPPQPAGNADSKPFWEGWFGDDSARTSPSSSTSGASSSSASYGGGTATSEKASNVAKEAEGGKLGMIVLGVGAAAITGYALLELLRRQQRNKEPESQAAK